jgi:hypothetical protein
VGDDESDEVRETQSPDKEEVSDPQPSSEEQKKPEKRLRGGMVKQFWR